jgi:hypothetical protein
MSFLVVESNNNLKLYYNIVNAKYVYLATKIVNLKIKQMKKIKVLMFAFVLAGMTVASCSSDDNNGPAATIDGKWNQVKTTVKINGQAINQDYGANVEGCDKNYVEFAAAAVFNEAVYFKAAGTGACQIDMAAPGTWTKSNKNLIISNDGDLEGNYEITKLTNSELQISSTKSAGGITSLTTVYLRRAN